MLRLALPLIRSYRATTTSLAPPSPAADRLARRGVIPVPADRGRVADEPAVRGDQDRPDPRPAQWAGVGGWLLADINLENDHAT